MRLIDADALENELGASEYDIYAKECLRDAPTIEVPRWIPVTERLPHKEWEEATENGMDLYPCLVVERYKGFEPVATKGWYDGKGFINAVSIDVSAVITHWMPLPDAPKDGDSE